VFGIKPDYKETIRRLLNGETIECLFDDSPASMVYDESKGCILRYEGVYTCMISVPLYNEKISFRKHIILFGKAYDEKKLKELIKNNLEEIPLG
jgi:hypothetical protein